MGTLTEIIYKGEVFTVEAGTEQLFEFKVDDARALSFFFSGRRVVLTHGFTKKSAKTPKRELERAHKIKNKFEGRQKHENK